MIKNYFLNIYVITKIYVVGSQRNRRLIGTVSMRQFFEHPPKNVKIDDKKKTTQFYAQKFCLSDPVKT